MASAASSTFQDPREMNDNGGERTEVDRPQLGFDYYTNFSVGPGTEWPPQRMPFPDNYRVGVNFPEGQDQKMNEQQWDVSGRLQSGE